MQIDVDLLFLEKWKRNMNRPEQYGQKRDVKRRES